MDKYCVFCGKKIEDDRKYLVCDDCMSLPYLRVVAILKEK
jgi:predicted nucleic acid-binding Zn ribbon protein